MKDDLQLRPIHHQLEHRIEAHIFVAFLVPEPDLRAHFLHMASLWTELADRPRVLH
jgi:hypothetical protein